MSYYDCLTSPVVHSVSRNSLLVPGLASLNVSCEHLSSLASPGTVALPDTKERTAFFGVR